MKILDTQVMRGPNQWSAVEKKLIVLKLSSDHNYVIDGQQAEIRERVGLLFPALAHLPGTPAPANTGALLAQVALGLQSAAGMHVAFFLTGSSPDGVHVVFAYQLEQAGLYAADAAASIMAELIDGKDVDVNEHVIELQRLRRRFGMGPTSTYLLQEVTRRGIPFRQFDHGSLITLGHGYRQKKIRTAVTDATSALGLEIAGDKEETKKLLAESNIPVPKGIIARSEEELIRRLQNNEVSFPVVLKPLDGNHGRGVTTDVNSIEKAVFAYQVAGRISKPVIVEEYIRGEDYRFLVINFQLVAAALRLPAHVTGDGRSTIQQLIDTENMNPDRGDTSEHVLAKIRVDESTQKILAEKNLTPDSVLPEGTEVRLKETANISAGGTAIDVTDKVHPENKFMAERVARMFNLDICGIDIMATAIDVPMTRETGAIIEVNAGPGLRMHSNPQEGQQRDVARPIIEMLFPKTASAEIPIVAVTGTNGKTTTTRLVAAMAMAAGHKPGYCTSDGIYINGHLTYEGDCTGAVSAQQVLFDPTIDFAVLECARGGIIRSGLGFDRCDVSIVTNVSEDHLGLKGIYAVEHMARVKKVVPLAAKPDGWAILNADDPLVYEFRRDLKCNVALFSTDPDNKKIQVHLQNNGLAAVLDDGKVVVLHGHRTDLGPLNEMPLTLGGKAEFMTRNILAAALAGIALGFDTRAISECLATFFPGPDTTPGRMNVFKFNGTTVLVDYAHNIDGFAGLRQFFKQQEGRKVAVISAPGDRRDNDIMGMGMLAAGTYDEIIVRNDEDLRGRRDGEVTDLLMQGIRQVNPALPVTVIKDEQKAIEEAIRLSHGGGWVLVCADKVKQTIAYVKNAIGEPQLQP